MGCLTKFDTDLEWQIDRRAVIQRFIHKLYAFLEEHREFPKENDDQWYPMMRMVYAAFSLWRSAFLTDVKQNRQNIYDNTKDFLKKVLTQNTISFNDDRNLAELTIGYYNSNARYRIERSYIRDEKLQQISSIHMIYRMRDEGDLDMKDQREIWDALYQSLEDYFKVYTEYWEKNVRPFRPKARMSRKQGVNADDSTS